MIFFPADTMKIHAQFFENEKAFPQKGELSFQSDALIWQEAQFSKIQYFPVKEIEIEKIPGAEKWKLKIKNESGSFLVEEAQWIKSLFKANPGLARTGNRPSRVLNFWAILLIFIGLVAGFALGLYYGTPWLADKAALSVSQKWETELGEGLMKEVLQNERIDHEKTKLIRAFYAKANPLKENEKGLPPIEITVVEKEEFNAFAIPGRKIVVYSGAIQSMKSYEELLALLGHESGHVVQRHSMRTLFRTLSVYGLVSLFVGDVSGVMAILIQNAQSLQQMSYSRDFEREADLSSYEFLCQNQADPNGIIRLLKGLQKKYGQLENKEYSFFNSHPLTEERIKNAEKVLKENPCGTLSENPEMGRLFSQLKKGDW